MWVHLWEMYGQCTYIVWEGTCVHVWGMKERDPCTCVGCGREGPVYMYGVWRRGTHVHVWGMEERDPCACVWGMEEKGPVYMCVGYGGEGPVCMCGVWRRVTCVHLRIECNYKLYTERVLGEVYIFVMYVHAYVFS